MTTIGRDPGDTGAQAISETPGRHPRSASDRDTLVISDIACKNLPPGNFWDKGYYLELAIDGRAQRTRSIKLRTTPAWAGRIDFPVTSNWTLEIRVFYERHRPRSDKLLAKVYVQSTEIGKDFGAENRQLTLEDAKRRVKWQHAVIEFSYKFSSSVAALEETMEQASTGIDALRLAPDSVQQAATAIESLPEVVDSFKPSLDILLKNVGTLVQFVDGMAQIHPYASAAWSLLSAVPKLLLGQVERDSRMHNLVDAMNDAYDFFTLADQLEAVKGRTDILESLFNETKECALFMVNYARDERFLKRALKHTISGADDKLGNFEQRFKDLKLAFLERTQLHTEKLVWKNAKDLQQLVTSDYLNQMPYASLARSTEKGACLPGTRVEILREITDWISETDSDSVKRVFWLHGLAGSGKSAIARTICDRYAKIGDPGSAFFFVKGDPARPANMLFSTISQNIADYSSEWRLALSAVLQRSKAMRTGLSISEQFEHYIYEIASQIDASNSTQQIVVVIDALDEAGDREERRQLLGALKEIGKLPSIIRFLITSRPEYDIREALKHQSFVKSKDMASIPRTSTYDDILRFVCEELPDMKEHHAILSEKAEEVFQWAATACRYIKTDSMKTPYERLETMLSSDATGLDSLYKRILQHAWGVDIDNTGLLRYRLILACVLAVFEPVTVKTLKTLWVINASQSAKFGYDKQSESIDAILRPLGSLLRGVSPDSADAVQPLHTSFRDFLTTSNRSGLFFVNLRVGHEVLALATLDFMQKSLVFNICHLETSHLRNSGVLDLEERIHKNIPSALAYACQHWTSHAYICTDMKSLFGRLEAFLREKSLFWLEVLSLLGKASTASPQLHVIQSMLKGRTEMQALISDLIRLVRMSAGAISISTPHLYISALAFVPRTSSLACALLTGYQTSLAASSALQIEWTACELLLVGHKNSISSVAFSPDGKQVVSGSHDNTLRIWDAETGAVTAGPFEGHFDLVTSVAFSPDGKRVVSGSWDKTLQIWDAETGAVTAGPFHGHTHYLTSVAFSPEGKWVVSGSSDRTLQIWDAETGAVTAGPFEGHTDWVTSVAFSPDGKRVVSGSDDRTLRIWDAETGALTAGPFEGHTLKVASVAFSPDGKQIVSGSYDKTLWIWDAETGAVTAGPFKGHTAPVASVAFSPDGKWVVSGSNDRTLQIWDVETGVVAAGPLKGHTDSVTSVAFSPDGKRVVSGSDDRTLRVWDVKIGAVTAGPFEGHTSWVSSVAFSPDGKQVVSGSHDKTLWIWDVETGAVIAGPFQGHTKKVTSAAFSPNGKRVVSGSDDRTLQIWDAETGALTAGPFEGHTRGVTSVAFSPDGKQVVSGSIDKTLRIWDAETGAVTVGPFRGHFNLVTSVAFSPDGKRVVSGSWDDTLQIWDAETGALTVGPLRGHTIWVTSVAFSPDGKRVISSSYDKTLQIWDAETGALTAGPFEGHTRGVASAAFSPDGKQIVSGSQDKTLRIWDAETGALIAGPFEGHTDQVTSVAFSPDGKQVVSGSWDNTLRIWDAETSTITTGLLGYRSHGLNSLSTLPHRESSMSVHCFEDGWLLGPSKELLFWVPPDYRTGFSWPGSRVLGARKKVHLDRFCVDEATSWTKCWMGQSDSGQSPHSRMVICALMVKTD